MPHIRLLLKLQYYGIGQPLLGWIQDFITNREQRVVINNTCSKWEQISSGIPQGSVLGTLLFVIYINDMPNNLHKSCLLFADDAKLFSKITVNDTSDAEILQQDLNRIQQWSSDWLMSFNHDKCVNLVVGSKRIITQIDIDFYMTDSNDEGRDIIRTLKKPLNEKDLGVYIDNNLDFKKHIDAITKKAHRTMGIIKRNFLYLDKNNFVPLYTTIVRPQLEYAQCIWSPYKRGDVRRIEAVQRYATRQVRGIRQLTYEERLRFLDLPTLVFRRMRGEMIEAYTLFFL